MAVKARKKKEDKIFRICLKPSRDDFGKVLREQLVFEVRGYNPTATELTEEGYSVFMLVNAEGRNVLIKNFDDIDYCVELNSIVSEECKQVEIKKGKLVSLPKVAHTKTPEA